MVAIPPLMPVTIPVLEPMVATEPSLLLHEPPEVASDSVLAAPAQRLLLPVIAVGKALTVTVRIVTQPAADVYVMTTLPALIPITTPEPSTVARVLSPEVQLPPVVASDNDVVEPTQTPAVPVMAAGAALTVSAAVV